LSEADLLQDREVEKELREFGQRPQPRAFAARFCDLTSR
jgi:hypothetical protein